MKRIVGILILIVFVVSLGVLEEIFINNFGNELKEKTQVVSVSISQNESNLNVDEVKDSFENLKNFWTHSKSILCYLVNYEKIKVADESLTKLESAIKTNDKNLANENVAVLKGYDEILHYLMGFNINNLF